MTSERKPLEEDVLARRDAVWKARAQKDEALMGALIPLIKRRAGGREIAGLKAWEESR